MYNVMPEKYRPSLNTLFTFSTFSGNASENPQNAHLFMHFPSSLFHTSVEGGKPTIVIIGHT